jgi:protein gp37
MAEQTAIEWTDATWNPWQGCTKVSPECANCYMFRDKRRYGQDPTIVHRSADATFQAILSPKKYKPSSKVFTCSWSDFFHPVADAWRAEAWQMIKARPDLIFQVLTKRTERILQCLPDDWGNGYPNVWLGATVGHPDSLHRIGELVRVRAAIRFLSMEPLLGDIDIEGWLLGAGCDDCGWEGSQASLREGTEPCPQCYGEHDPKNGEFCISPRRSPIHWVIAGAESGPNARPSHPNWFRSLRYQCAAVNVPLFFKQWGEWIPRDQCDSGVLHDGDNGHFMACRLDDGWIMYRAGKKRTGRLLDGKLHHEFPEPSHA